MGAALRIIVRANIWRAFPELDQYDDETCMRYIMQGKETASNPFGYVIYFGAVCLGLVIWAVVGIVAYLLYQEIDQKTLNSMLGFGITLLAAIIGLGVIWMPAIVLLFARDRVMWSQVKRRLRGASCFQCKYCLIGLSPSDGEHGRGIRCPECGLFYCFNAGYITEADIDPTRLTES
jgi:hypothetical protein